MKNKISICFIFELSHYIGIQCLQGQFFIPEFVCDEVISKGLSSIQEKKRHSIDVSSYKSSHRSVTFFNKIKLMSRISYLGVYFS